MTDKVQLIKQEIERIEQILDDFNKTHNNTIDNGIVSAKKNICKHIKSFINSLPEEAGCEANCTTKNDDLEEETEEEFYKCAHYEESVSGESSLLEAPGHYETVLTKDEFSEIVKHFANWQKRQIMKDAVDATVLEVDAQTVEFGLWPEKLLSIKEGDKVKIIIIKEE